MSRVQVVRFVGGAKGSGRAEGSFASVEAGFTTGQFLLAGGGQVVPGALGELTYTGSVIGPVDS